MARKRGGGFSLTPDKRNGFLICRFWHAGETVTLSTRTRDPAEARRIAVQL